MRTPRRPEPTGGSSFTLMDLPATLDGIGSAESLGTTAAALPSRRSDPRHGSPELSERSYERAPFGRSGGQRCLERCAHISADRDRSGHERGAGMAPRPLHPLPTTEWIIVSVGETSMRRPRRRGKSNGVLKTFRSPGHCRHVGRERFIPASAYMYATKRNIPRTNSVRGMLRPAEISRGSSYASSSSSSAPATIFCSTSFGTSE